MVSDEDCNCEREGRRGKAGCPCLCAGHEVFWRACRFACKRNKTLRTVGSSILNYLVQGSVVWLPVVLSISLELPKTLFFLCTHGCCCVSDWNSDHHGHKADDSIK